MKHILSKSLGLTAALALLSSPLLPAQTVLFSDNFDTDTSANWTVTEGSGNGIPDYAVFFAFDYLTNTFTRNGVTGTIPPAPNGGGKGVKMYVNKNDATAATAAVSIYPNGQNFGDDYALKFDMWLNYNGPAFGGTGSTEFGTFGINHLGTGVTWDNAGTIGDGVWFAVTGEGGAAGDYRAYAGYTRWTGQLGGFLDRNGDLVYEEEVIDGEQVLSQLFPSPQFETPGAPGKQWVQVEIRQRTNEFAQHVTTWLMNGYVIAEHTLADSGGSISGNIMLGNMDVYSSIADPKQDNFVIYDNVRVISLQGVPPNPVVTLTATDDTASEPGSDTGAFTVTRTGGTAAALTVNYRVSGTATSGSDYTALPGSVTIPAGQSSATILVTPLNDTIGESTETVSLFLLGNSNYDVYTNYTATVNILDDGDIPFATVTALRTNAYERNPDNDARFSINLSSQNAAATTVNFNLGGTAVAGTDYTGVGNSVVIPAGQTNALVRIRPINNNVTDPSRSVVLTVTSGAGYLVGAQASATAYIRDDDFIPTATLLYSENFDTDHTANWVVNPSALVDYVADLFFDYSSVGIPPAPNTTGGTTRGAKLQANLYSAVFGGVSISPAGLNLTPTDYALRFDLWQNFNGPMPAGGNGSTQISGGGVGTAGTTPQWPGGTQDSVWFATAGDGGSSVDYRAYSSAAPTGYGDTSGVFAAGNVAGVRNNTHPYYAEFGQDTAPAEQLFLYPGQTGATAAGAQAFVWRDIVIEKKGTTVKWYIDGKLIATVNASATNFAGGNILLNHSDINATSSADPLAPFLAFGLFDNVRVYDLTQATPPRIRSIQLINGGTQVQIDFTAGSSDLPGAFTLQTSANVATGYTDTPATITSLGGDQFRAVRAVGGAAQFYRIRR